MICYPRVEVEKYTVWKRYNNLDTKLRANEKVVL